MKRKLKIISDVSNYEYQYEYGYFKDDLLTNLSRREKRINLDILKEVGVFKKGLLNGVGYKANFKDIFEFGLYKDGNLLSFEEAIKGKKSVNIKDFKLGDFSFGDAWVYYNDSMSIVKGDNSILYIMVKDKKYCGLGIAEINNQKELFYFDPVDSCVLVNWRFRSIAKTVRIRKGTVNLKEIYGGKYDVNIYIPNTVKKIADHVVYNSDYFEKIKVDVYYDGTMEEWNNIERGRWETKTTEDWYGYYYHNTDRYETYDMYIPWFNKTELPVIHCLDGIFTEKETIEKK